MRIRWNPNCPLVELSAMCGRHAALVATLADCGVELEALCCRSIETLEDHHCQIVVQTW